jgi:hypothetical protein
MADKQGHNPPDDGRPDAAQSVPSSKRTRMPSSSIAYLLMAVGRAGSLVHDRDPGHVADQDGQRGG